MTSLKIFKRELRVLADAAPSRVGGNHEVLLGRVCTNLRIGAVWPIEKTSRGNELKAHVLLASTATCEQTVLRAVSADATYHTAHSISWMEASIPTDPKWLDLNAPTALGRMTLHSAAGVELGRLGDLRGQRRMEEARAAFASGFVILETQHMTFGGLPIELSS